MVIDFIKRRTQWIGRVGGHRSPIRGNKFVKPCNGIRNGSPMGSKRYWPLIVGRRMIDPRAKRRQPFFRKEICFVLGTRRKGKHFKIPKEGFMVSPGN